MSVFPAKYAHNSFAKLKKRIEQLDQPGPSSLQTTSVFLQFDEATHHTNKSLTYEFKTHNQS